MDLVLEVTESKALTGAALEHIRGDAFMPDEERGHAESAVKEDEAEALAYLIDPFDLLSEVPGVDLAQASWSTEPVEYDPESMEWDLDEEDGPFGGDGPSEGDDEDEDDEDGPDAADPAGAPDRAGNR
ncbi:hypothetical protein [Streptomyces sp. NPDC097619]|uniref:hypothetical protein n=1 Tax=Streptomyces sp. NPDC097619 TaxID=3157228 RepID=UPI00332B1D5D